MNGSVFQMVPSGNKCLCDCVKILQNENAIGLVASVHATLGCKHYKVNCFCTTACSITLGSDKTQKKFSNRLSVRAAFIANVIRDH